MRQIKEHIARVFPPGWRMPDKATPLQKILIYAVMAVISSLITVFDS